MSPAMSIKHDDALEIFARKIKERGIDVKLSMAESGQVGDHAMDCLDLLYADEEIASVIPGAPAPDMVQQAIDNGRKALEA